MSVDNKLFTFTFSSSYPVRYPASSPALLGRNHTAANAVVLCLNAATTGSETTRFRHVWRVRFLSFWTDPRFPISVLQPTQNSIWTSDLGLKQRPSEGHLSGQRTIRPRGQSPIVTSVDDHPLRSAALGFACSRRFKRSPKIAPTNYAKQTTGLAILRPLSAKDAADRNPGRRQPDRDAEFPPMSPKPGAASASLRADSGKPVIDAFGQGTQNQPFCFRSSKGIAPDAPVVSSDVVRGNVPIKTVMSSSWTIVAAVRAILPQVAMDGCGALKAVEFAGAAAGFDKFIQQKGERVARMREKTSSL